MVAFSQVDVLVVACVRKGKGRTDATRALDDCTTVVTVDLPLNKKRLGER